MRLKDAVLGAARGLGLFAAVRDSAWRKRRLLILCYHGVSAHDEHEWSPTLYVTPAKLRARMEQLRAGGYNILPLAEGVRRMYEGTLPERSVAITFDDGAADFETSALPILREFNAPATLYLTTFYCDAQLPVFDTVLAYVMFKGRASGGDVASILGSPTPLPVSTDAERRMAWEQMYEHARATGMSAEAKDLMVARVAALVGVDYAEVRRRRTLQIMSPDAVRALPADLIDVQLHTHRHRTPRDRTLFLREIDDNAARINDISGNHVLNHFCYPMGDYFGEFFEWLRERGVEYATTCVHGVAGPDSDPMLIPRFVDTMLQSDAMFEAWTSGFAEFLPSRREYRLDPARLASLPEVAAG